MRGQTIDGFADPAIRSVRVKGTRIAGIGSVHFTLDPHVRRASWTAREKDLVTYDPAKNALYIRERGLSFELAEAMDWSSAVVEYDRRADYGEERYVATGLIKGRLHVLVFTPRGEDLRVISLRRANQRELAAYAR